MWPFQIRIKILVLLSHVFTIYHFLENFLNTAKNFHGTQKYAYIETLFLLTKEALIPTVLILIMHT